MLPLLARMVALAFSSPSLTMGATSTREFRSVSNEIARLLIYEATKGFRTEKHTVEGWAGPVEIEAISGKMVTVVPILRAGVGLMDGVLDMFFSAIFFCARRQPCCIDFLIFLRPLGTWQRAECDYSIDVQLPAP